VVDPALQQLVDEPLGGPEVKAALDRHLSRAAFGEKPPECVSAMAKRINRRFLPQGRRLPKDDKPERDEFAARQIDLEEAIEAAGGKRGGARS
jgi:hypothetical protein